MRHAALLLLLLALPAPASAAVTVRQMIDDGRYWQPPCDDRARICILTGLGGFIDAWKDHVDRHDGYLFVVRGMCASACAAAYDRAVAQGQRVKLGDRAIIIRHRPSRTRWK